MDKFPGMCELRDKITPWEAWDSKNIQVRLEPPSGTTLAMVCFFL
jgi:hypothetical protein